MKSSVARFLQVVIGLLGLVVLTFLLGEPHLEGRNAGATLYQIYFQDPFLAFVYAGSIPFFVALYRAFGLLEHVRQTGTFSQVTVQGLRTIQRCALTIIGFVFVVVLLILRFGDGEDRPGGIFMSLLVTVGAGSIALVAAKLSRHVQSSLERSGRRPV